MSTLGQLITTHLSEDGKWLCTVQHCDGVHHYYVKLADETSHPR